jgi:hypothetical protein
MIRAAKLENSPRLQRVHRLLRDGRERTTLQISRQANVCAVNSAIDELRDPKNGFDIPCVRRGKHWYYRMKIRKSRKV